MTNEIGVLRAGLAAMRESPTAAPPNKPAGNEVVKSQAKADVAETQQRQNPEEVAEEVVNGLNDLVQELHRELKFSVDKDSGDTVIKVVDQKTDEVVRQIPPEEVLNLRKRLMEAAGVIFSDSA